MTNSKGHYAAAKSAVSSNVPQNESSSVAKSLGADEGDQTAAFVDSTTLSDSKPVIFPSSDSAANIYPYNQVRQYEGGHFKEYDSTPGSERIQEKHRSGTGYEIDPSGGLNQVVVGDGYRAVLGSDHIIVHGSCQIIVAGDVGIKADGDINLNAGADLNMLVGGNLNVKVGGDKAERISGSALEAVSGDKSISVDGYFKQASEGDYMVEGLSVNIGATDSDVNVSANNNMNLFSLGENNILGKGSLSFTTTGDSNTSIGGSSIHETSGSFTINSNGDINQKSTGFDVTSETHKIKSDSYVADADSMALKSSSVIQTTPKVSHSVRADICPC